MFKNRFLVLICVVITACAPSPVQLTSTANFAIAQTETAAPTTTYTPSPTLTHTPTLTPTKTPIPTPLGGGSGKLVISVSDKIAFGGLPDSFSQSGGIYQINPNGIGLRQLLSPSEIESVIGNEFTWAYFGTRNQQNHIITEKGVYLVSDDWQLINKVELDYSEFITLISDFNHIYWIDAGGNKYITNGELGIQIRFGPSERIKGWSADGTTIYFIRDYGNQMWAVNSDGTNKRKLELVAFKEFRTDNWPRRLDTYATSSNKVAFTWVDQLFVTDAADLEFSNPQFIAQIPTDHFALKLVLSPDGNFVLVWLNRCEELPTSRTCGTGDIILVNTLSGKIERTFSVKDIGYVEPCGFSPDSKQFILRAGSGVKIFEINSNSSIDIEVPEYYFIGCPIWQ